MNSRKMQALLDTLICNQALLTDSLRLAAEEYKKSAGIIREETKNSPGNSGLLSLATRLDEQSVKAFELADLFEVLERG